MKATKNEGVQKFLAETQMLDAAKFNILVTIRKIVFKTYPKAEERMMYGGILFSLDAEDFSGVFIRKHHVSLEFSKGYLMNDPEKLLEGVGKFRRHLKFKDKEDIRKEKVLFFVEQAV